MTPLQTLPKNVGDLGKLIVAKGYEKLLKVQKIAQSGHTGRDPSSANCVNRGTTRLKNLYYNINSLPSYLLVHS